MKKTGTAHRLISLLLVLSLICITLFGCVQQGEAKVITAGGMLAVHFIDVGQGDCELIVAPTGETMLIDAGISSSGDDIVDYISELGITEIDVFVATHYHADHIGGSPDVFEAFDILSVLILDCEVSTATARKLKSDIEKEGSEIIYAERGLSLELGDVDFLTISPKSITDGGGNNDSIMLRMQYGDSRYIFTGDAEKEAEEDVLDYYDKEDLSADLLKVGHHGSSTSTSTAFLSTVSPSVAVISCGVGNSYGHPHTKTLDKLLKSAKYVYRTDVEGDIVIMTDGKSIYFNGQ